MFRDGPCRRLPLLIAEASILACLANCAPGVPDYSANEGARAWLAYHKGTIPRECIVEMIEKYGDTVVIDEKSRAKAHADAMQIAGETYAISLASEKLVSAREDVLAVEEEGFARGLVVEQAVLDAKVALNEAIFDWKLSRIKLAGLDACDFTATDEQFGFKTRSEVYY